jgi:hypothetical protein
MPVWEYGYKEEGDVTYPNYHPTHKIITCSVYGESSDGYKVWVEIDEQGNPVNQDVQYFLSWQVINGKQVGAFYRA